VRRIEDMGYSSVVIPDHLTLPGFLDMTAGLMAAADATQTLRVLSLVAANDFRHPVLLHKAAASVDVLSGGRLELGVGAGWWGRDYAATGMPFDPPGRRIARLAEAVAILKGLFGPEPFIFEGEHYRITELDGQPKPVQKPHPPLLIAGGGKRILTLAGREADIVGINATLTDSAFMGLPIADASAERVDEKVGWARAAARAAGRSDEDIELQLIIPLMEITDTPETAQAARERLAAGLGTTPEALDDSPAVLVGTLEACVDRLQDLRARFGFNYFHPPDAVAAAPLVARLAGS
jgi:probable F420-dependent oxidoreductase